MKGEVWVPLSRRPDHRKEKINSGLTEHLLSLPPLHPEHLPLMNKSISQYKSTNDRTKPLELTGYINETETFTKQATFKQR